MPGLFVAIVLIASLLLVHFSMRAQPMPVTTPLNVDTGLPLPEVGQASTVFSLTALFGAYLGIYLFLGIPAFAGLACGTVVGLFVVRGWVCRHGSQTFEEFLSALLSGSNGNAGVFALAVSAAQCAYAASELLILRELVRVSLALNQIMRQWWLLLLRSLVIFMCYLGAMQLFSELTCFSSHLLP